MYGPYTPFPCTAAAKRHERGHLSSIPYQISESLRISSSSEHLTSALPVALANNKINYGISKIRFSRIKSDREMVNTA
jgi:hypothetical protein